MPSPWEILLPWVWKPGVVEKESKQVVLCGAVSDAGGPAHDPTEASEASDGLLPVAATNVGDERLNELRGVHAEHELDWLFWDRGGERQIA